MKKYKSNFCGNSPWCEPDQKCCCDEWENFRDEIETTTTTDWLGIASIVIVLVASLIIVNELLGNPLLDYLTR